MGLEKQIKKANLRVYVIGLTYGHKTKIINREAGTITWANKLWILLKKLLNNNLA